MIANISKLSQRTVNCMVAKRGKTGKTVDFAEKNNSGAVVPEAVRW